MEPDRLVVILRALIYVGSMAAAGGVLFGLSFPEAARAVERVLRRQVVIGCLLILVVEPLCYATFQVAAADGDWAAAFAPDLRWMAFQTGFGQAASVRVVAAGLMLVPNRRPRSLSLAAAAAMIGSVALEGHTRDAANEPVLAALLIAHFAAVCWWLGALVPLLALLRCAPPELAATTVAAFGRRALWIVLALVAAGGLLLVSLTGAALDPASAYQQRFACKLTLVLVLLALAAWNRLRLTPLIASRYAVGERRLRLSIKGEIAIALSILGVTAWIITSSPHP